MNYCSSCGQRLSDSCTVCPVCGHEASDAVKSPKVPYDAEKYRHGTVRYASGRPVVTYVLLALNALVFLAIHLLGASGYDLTSLLSMHRGAVASGQVYRILTSLFTHEELYHLASNGYALFIYGMLLEPAIGKGRFLLVYFTGGLLGNMLTFAFMANPSIGASGAVFGLLGAVVAIRFINPTAMSRTMMTNVILCVFLTTAFSLTGGINNVAHFGGMFGGYMMTCISIRGRFQKKLFTSRPLLALLLFVLFTGSVLWGLPRVQSADERRYGDYTAMLFHSVGGRYDLAQPFAEAILADERNEYQADAAALLMLYFAQNGDEAAQKRAAGQLEASVQNGIYMHDETLYHALTDDLNG